MTVGILALQGNFSRHAEALARRGVEAKEIRKREDALSLSALILPGGESSTMLSLLSPDLRDTLVEQIRGGLPVLATCAGLILLARRVEHPEQESLGLINIDVRRNAYGRQLDSFIAELDWCEDSRDAARGKIEGVFIRAPKITRVGDNVSTVLAHQGDPVLVRYRNILGATFHPELAPSSEAVHELFLNRI